MKIECTVEEIEKLIRIVPDTKATDTISIINNLEDLDEDSSKIIQQNLLKSL